jgi:hypothetical protein
MQAKHVGIVEAVLSGLYIRFRIEYDVLSDRCLFSSFSYSPFPKLRRFPFRFSSRQSGVVRSCSISIVGTTSQNYMHSQHVSYYIDR